MNGLHLLKAPQWMAFGNELRDWALMEGARDQQDNIVDHVAVSDKVQEGGQRLYSVIPHVLEFNHQLLPQFIINHGHRERGGLIGQELTIISTLKMELQVWKAMFQE